ncbi:MAG: hypothetical protein ACQEP6_00265 [Patescibacteria group bacterium]
MSSFNKNEDKGVFAIYKRVGETPLNCLERARVAFPYLRNRSLSYAGRLDPLAEGVLLVLVGEKNKEREKYLKCEKVYHFDVLFGVESDSYDPLGIVKAKKKKKIPYKHLLRKLEEFSVKWQGEATIEYPPFSSKTHKGKPLFKWAREGRRVPLPTRSIFIHEFDLLDLDLFPASFIHDMAKYKIGMVMGDFRQEECLKSWEEAMKIIGKSASLPVARFRVRASSGTYVRTLAQRMGEHCHSSALAFHIIRTSVGSYNLKDTFI